MGVLTDADRVALALLCDSLASYVAAKAIVAEEGSTFETTNESGGRMVRAHPVVAMGAEASRFAKVMLGEFGLTPAARSKVSRVDATGMDPLEQWLAEAPGS
jgi:P27 family predicted phage terminase small subunit